MTVREDWQQLRSLESRDLVKDWFKIIHQKDLKTRRANEINFASRQAREYFKNASRSDYTVRPLLTFYGVASLSKALLLLLRKNGGEECLHKGHGLETISWDQEMSGDIPNALDNLGNLKVKTNAGLFTGFLDISENLICLHINSTAVGLRLKYPLFDTGLELSFTDLVSRMPDLKIDYKNISDMLVYAVVSQMTVSETEGFKAIVNKIAFSQFQNYYENIGYICTPLNNDYIDISCSFEVYKNVPPQFIHHYVKRFGNVPGLYISKPFNRDARLSQIAITYVVSYYLGMLVRYYPTQWVSMIQGSKGDRIWPTINRAQHSVEVSFPKLVIEMIQDIVKERTL